MSTLTIDRFAEFFEALYGYRPFRWQSRLAAIVANADWPRTLRLPTASGKTACIDIALFALACQAKRPFKERTAPRRIFFVVDRRIIVDEAYDRARIIAKQLREAKKGILKDVADQLRTLAGGNDQDPLLCCELRGGIYRDHAWAKTPIQPTVICSTVDQIGSRLLFRGYGCGPSTSVIHAGLAANDALIILDEAHCAKPFTQTGRAIQNFRQQRTSHEIALPPFHFVVMSATPPSEIDPESIFPKREDWDFDLKQPDQATLALRINAPKPARLVIAEKAKGSKALELFAEFLADKAIELGEKIPRRIGIIVNRVATAQKLHALLKDKQLDTLLLTGRMRAIDRDDLIDNWIPKNKSSNEVRGLSTWFAVTDSPLALDHSVFVVATQCLEVGANLDFDILITECASLDALRQRFGRLNRAGRPIEAQALIAIRGDQVEPKEPDPVYGSSLTATWNWLREHAQSERIDLGISAFESLKNSLDSAQLETMSTLEMPSRDAPVMHHMDVDRWAQTSPVPMPDPDPAIFLHGLQDQQPDVQVCWRRDLLIDGNDPTAKWSEILSHCPPTTAECLPVPIHVFDRWLRNRKMIQSDLSDLETAVNLNEGEGDGTSKAYGIRWRGAKDSVMVGIDLPKPGDTFVLPFATRDEMGSLGYIPDESSQHRIDRGDELNFDLRRRAVLRIHPDIMAEWDSTWNLDKFKELLEKSFEDISYDEVRSALSDFSPEEGNSLGWIRDALLNDRKFRFVAYPNTVGSIDEIKPEGLIIVGSKRLKRGPEGDTESFTAEDDTSSMTQEVHLQDHLDGVSEMTTRFAVGSGLDPCLVTDFEFVARHHDLGKLDLRFQSWLFGGDTTKARLSPFRLAKSQGSTSKAARQRAQLRSGYPNGGRHEFVSLRLVEQAENALATLHDRELVLHLIGSHHSHCRPFASTVFDEHPVDVTAEIDGESFSTSSDTKLDALDSGVSERFWTLIRRYGWWGLAWLESIFILADHRCSEHEQEKETQ